MAHISTLGAGFYSELRVTGATSSGVTTLTTADTTDDTAAEFLALATVAVTSVRSFPSVGAPANIVNVPVFGQDQSSQIQAQPDAPTAVFTLNWLPGDSVQSAIQAANQNNTNYSWGVRASNAELPATLAATTVHSDFWVHANIASFLPSVSASDANTVELTLATQSDWYGPFTTT